MKNSFLVTAAVMSSLILIQTSKVWALDAESKKALEETQALMRDSKQRNEYISKDAKAKKADDFLQQLSDGDQQFSADTYSLAAEVFEIMVRESNGDPKKMEAAIQEYSRNPAAFAEKWSPAQKEKLKALSEKVNKPALPTR